MFAKVNGDTSFYQKAIFVLSRFGESNEGVSGVFFKQRVACLAEHQLLSLIIFGQKCPRLAVLEPKLLIRHFVPSLLAHVSPLAVEEAPPNLSDSDKPLLLSLVIIY